MDREKVAKLIHEYESRRKSVFGYSKTKQLECADQIIALLPKPTVKVTCDKCGGEGNLRANPECYLICPHYGCIVQDRPDEGDEYKGFCTVNCTCTDGKADREIEWEVRTGVDFTDTYTLTLTDLLDPDVAVAYGHLCHCVEMWLDNRDIFDNFKIDNNKGTLRVKGA
jgi:hypothetical protein